MSKTTTYRIHAGDRVKVSNRRSSLYGKEGQVVEIQMVETNVAKREILRVRMSPPDPLGLLMFRRTELRKVITP